MMGASQEVYQLASFPATLVGRTVREAAGFIFDSCHAVLLAVEATKGVHKHRMSVADLDQVGSLLHCFLLLSPARWLMLVLACLSCNQPSSLVVVSSTMT